MLEIGQHQLLMLLLVVEPDFDDVGDLALELGVALEETVHVLVDVRSIGFRFLETGTGHDAAARPRKLLTHRVVV